MFTNKGNVPVQFLSYLLSISGVIAPEPIENAEKSQSRDILQIVNFKKT